MRFGRGVLAALVLSSAAEAATIRFPLVEDVQRCLTATVDLVPQNGRLRLTLMLRRDGSIYAAYVHNQSGIVDRRLQRCIANQALVWTFDPAATPYERPYEIHFLNGVINLPVASHAPAPAPLDPETAQATLDLDEKATPVEQGMALVDVHEYAKAIPILRGAEGVDAKAGLARALAESGGDLGEARKLAQTAATEAPSRAVAREALLRVCMAQGDRACMADEWRALTAAPDFAPRTLVAKEQLEQPVRRAVCELNAIAAKSNPAACGQLSLRLEPDPAPAPFTDSVALQGPRRGPQWWAYGGYGLASIFAAMGAVTGEALSTAGNRTGDYSDHRKAYRGALIGAAVGIVPGILFGEAARSESSSQERQVITLLDVSGTMAMIVAYSMINRAH